MTPKTHSQTIEVRETFGTSPSVDGYLSTVRSTTRHGSYPFTNDLLISFPPWS